MLNYFILSKYNFKIDKKMSRITPERFILNYGQTLCGWIKFDSPER